MQPKVSIVMPCYNAAHAIENMLNSIIAQKWGNIELILVNDGSTDGTREIIAKYESGFKKRGFELVIVEQENQGVAAAVYEGLKRISGEFVCQVDADDELDPKYVNIMAEWLTEHPEYDLVACDSMNLTEKGAYNASTFPLGVKLDYKIEKYIFDKVLNMVWRYLFRVSYLLSCNLLEHFYTGREHFQELQMLLPLVAGKGKIKYFQIPLYKYTYYKYENHISYTHWDNLNWIIKHFKGRDTVLKYVINYLPFSSTEKQRLLILSEFFHIHRLLHYFLIKNQQKENSIELLREYIDMVNSYFSPNPCILYNEIDDIRFLIAAVEDNILCVEPNIKLHSNRIVAWGALGQNGKALLPFLKGTSLEPTELWDITGDGTKVKKPNIDSLTKNDIVLIFPTIGTTAANIRTELDNVKCSILFYEEIVRYISMAKYPRFYNGSIQLRKTIESVICQTFKDF
jgi:glycosyltransferase involved in cell wall biosynthesis